MSLFEHEASSLNSMFCEKSANEHLTEKSMRIHVMKLQIY